MKCYQCTPDLTNIAQTSNYSVSVCANPSKTIDCSQDPLIGKIADSCFTARLTASIYSASLNSSLSKSDIEVYVLNCSVMSLCSTLKTQTCQYVQTALQGIPLLQLKSCGVTCCEGDLCNDPSPSSTVPSSVPPATALFGILVLMAFTVVNVQRSGHCLME